MKLRSRIVLCSLAGVAGFIASFSIFSFTYVRWAVWRYPHNNSMAGLAALMYGVPIGMAVAAGVFLLVSRATRARNTSLI